jgi:uncharacterized membrane protein YfcA
VPLFSIVLPTVLILFLSALIRQLTGFGHALLAIPLVTLVVGIRIASPLVTLAGVVIGAVATARTWRMVEYKSLWPLVTASILGIPLGTSITQKKAQNHFNIFPTNITLPSLFHNKIWPHAKVTPMTKKALIAFLLT